MDNMKKVPFSLELAKQGVAFYVCEGAIPAYYIAHDGNQFWSKFTYKERIERQIETIKDGWFHLIPEEPVKERWAIISKNFIYESKESAEKDLGSSSINYVIVKLAE